MNNKEFKHLEEHLRNAPKPSMTRSKKQEIHENLSNFHEAHERQSSRISSMRKTLVWICGTAAVILLSIVTAAYFHKGNRNASTSKVQQEIHHFYIEGIVTMLQTSSDKVDAITVDVKRSYTDGTSSKFHYQTGDTPTFKLHEPVLKKDLPFSKGSTVIVEYTGSSATPLKRKKMIWHGATVYYQKNSQYFDMQGNPAIKLLPPKLTAKNTGSNHQNELKQKLFLDSRFQQFRSGGKIVSFGKQSAFRIKPTGKRTNYEIDQTIDGGKSWIKKGNVHAAMLYGLSFINQKTGFIVRNSAKPGPVLLYTHDGGKQWKNKTLQVPGQYKGYVRNARFPVFFTRSVGVLPVFGSKDGQENLFLYMLVTQDSGATWKPVLNKTQIQQYGKIKWRVQGNFVDVTYKKAVVKIIG